MPFPLLKAKWVFVTLITGIVILGMAIRIMDASVLCVKNKECKPLLDSTLGEFLGSQALMNQDIKYIREHPNDDYNSIQIHKDRLIRSTMISLFMIWLVWKIFDVLFGLALSQEQKNTWLRLLLLLITLIVIYLANMLYLGLNYGQWNFIPFNGFFDSENGLVFNINTLFESVGVYTNPLLNQTIINETGMVV